MTERIVEVMRKRNLKALRSEIRKTIRFHDTLIPKIRCKPN